MCIRDRPEGWTKYGADGVEIRPLQRYKALGNAIALPCADYIMAGIYEVLADRAEKEDQGGSDRKYIVLLKQYENAQHQSF